MGAAERLGNYIDGRWQTSRAGEYREVINPATARTLALAPLSPAAEVDAAAEAAA